MDATLAWSLQQEDAQQAASAARRFQSDNVRRLLYVFVFQTTTMVLNLNL